MHRPRMEALAMMAALAGMGTYTPTSYTLRDFGGNAHPRPMLMRSRRPTVNRYPGSVARAKGWAWEGDGIPSKVKPAKVRRRSR